MSQELYYTAPSDEMFEEIKREAIKIWESYDNAHGYVDEKVGSIKDIKNIKDNYMWMVAIFDPFNQDKLFAALKPETVARIVEAMS